MKQTFFAFFILLSVGIKAHGATELQSIAARAQVGNGYAGVTSYPYLDLVSESNKLDQILANSDRCSYGTLDGTVVGAETVLQYMNQEVGSADGVVKALSHLVQSDEVRAMLGRIRDTGSAPECYQSVYKVFTFDGQVLTLHYRNH